MASVASVWARSETPRRLRVRPVLSSVCVRLCPVAPRPLSAAAAAAAAVPAVQQGMDEVRSRVTKMLSSTAIQSKSSQLTGLFRKK